MKQIKNGTRQDKSLIEELRISEFSRSTEFKLLKPDKLRWSQTDDESIVLVVIDEKDTAIATMRGITVENSTTAEKTLQCTIPETVKFPIMIFTSAATLKPFRRKGFNQLIRLYFLKYALNNNIKTLVSPIYSNAPRIDFMGKLGYEFITPEKNWQDKLNPTSERQLGILNAEKIEHAIAIIENFNALLIADYPWNGHKLLQKSATL